VNRIPWHTKALFGLSGVVENTKFQIYEFFLIFYYAQVLGLAGSLAGLAVAIALIADALVDPLIGSYSDSLRSRLGRRHTLMFLAILPTAIFIYLLFAAPRGLSQSGLFAWLLVNCIAVRVVGSLYTVPAAAMAAELTDHYADRAELGVWRQAIAALSQMALTWLIFNIAFTPSAAFPRGQENADNYPKFALLVAAVIVTCALLGAAGTFKHLRAFELQRLVARPRRFAFKDSLLATWRALVDLRNFRALFLGLLFAGIMGSYFRSLNLHLSTYFWELTTRQTGAWLLATQIAMFVAALGSRFAITRFEPQRLYLCGVALMLLAYVLPPLARLLDLLPVNGADSLPSILYAANVVVGIGTGVLMTCSLVMFTETTDEYAFVKRESRTGMLLAFLPLGNKAASSLGKLLGGVVVQWLALPIGGAAAAAAPQTVRSLGIASIGVTLVAGAVALYLFSRFDLTRQRYAEIRAGLATLRANSKE
jgi:GPH family glycoside/pentoside/hexuronide:cation symporter